MRIASLIAAVLINLSNVQAAVTFLPVPDGHYSVPVFVNDAGPYPFILDTAADSSGVYQWFAEHARLPSNGTQTSGSGMAAIISVPEYRVRTFEMDSHKIHNIVAYALPSPHHSGKLAGILGNDFMDKTITVFDFPCRRIEILPNRVSAATLAGKGSPPIAGYRAAGETLLSFPIRLNGAEGVAVLDTGNRLTKINSRFAQAAGLRLSSDEFHSTNTRYGIGAVRMISTQGPLGDIQIGEMIIPAVHGEVINLPSFKELYGDKPAMIIGVDLLQRFRVIYEHDQNRFWLRSSTCE